MPEVNAQQRQNAKAAAANAAVAANDAAVVLGAAGLLVAAGGVASGVGALAGVGGGLVLGVCSFGAWAIGNRYQRLANDPPRDDFDQVTFSGAQLFEGNLPAAEPDATAVRYAAIQLIAIDAMSALVTSLERFDGAVAAGDTTSASAQADAAQFNANVVRGAHSALVGWAVPMNEAWSATTGTVDLSLVTFDQAPDFLATAVSPDSVGLGSVLPCVTGLLEDPVADLNPAIHPLISSGQLPPMPGQLISGNLNDAIVTVSDPLSFLVDPDSA